MLLDQQFQYSYIKNTIQNGFYNYQYSSYSSNFIIWDIFQSNSLLKFKSCFLLIKLDQGLMFYQIKHINYHFIGLYVIDYSLCFFFFRLKRICIEQITFIKIDPRYFNLEKIKAKHLTIIFIRPNVTLIFQHNYSKKYLQIRVKLKDSKNRNYNIQN
ncbi:unnamed protein product [Paramecium sonneborni]|uniref:Transmembrane protein n=1 Tax=Paramecium sonneborni TaxID=65129 RepID=A0A8S1RW12_9CILI|nr:unnamed protein product [Paramecium sonneborni]